MRKTYRRKSYKKKLTTRRRQRKNHKKSVRNHKRKTFRHKRKIGGDEEVNIPTLKGLEEGDRVLFQIEKPIFKDEMERIEDEEFSINSKRIGTVYSKPYFTADPDVYLVRLELSFGNTYKVYDFYFTNNIEKADNKHINQISIIKKLEPSPPASSSENAPASFSEDGDMPSVPAYVSSPQSWRPSDNGDFE
jgi:hypothetical protein